MKYNRLSDFKIKKIIGCFVEDLPASKTSNLLHINRNTINSYFNEFRVKILHYLEHHKENFSGEIELDESYFGAKRIRGKRGRGAAGKTPVFGLLKRDSFVYVPVPNCLKQSLIAIIKGNILERSTIYTDGWRAYDGLILNGYDHYRVYHSHNEFARGKNHVNGIESFWSFTKRRLNKFNGLSNDKFILHLKESEFRWNYKKYDLNSKIWKIFKR